MELVIPHISQPIKVWEKIEIVVGDDDNRGIYMARIEDFINGGIIITKPEYLSGRTLLRDKCEVSVWITKQDAVYEFFSVIKKFNSRSSEQYILSPPQSIRRLQRRQFVRIDHVAKIRLITVEEFNATPKKGWQACTTCNISGGGALVKCQEPIASSQVILINMDVFGTLGINQPIAAVCRRACKVENQPSCGIEFLIAPNLGLHLTKDKIAHLPDSIKEFDRLAQNQLVNWVFQQQIGLRKKGLI